MKSQTMEIQSLRVSVNHLMQRAKSLDDVAYNLNYRVGYLEALHNIKPYTPPKPKYGRKIGEIIVGKGLDAFANFVKRQVDKIGRK